MYSGGTGRFRVRVNPDLPTGRRRIGLLFGPAVERLGFRGRVIQFRRWRRNNLTRVLHAAGGESLDQLDFRGGAAPDRVHAGQMPRATERQDDPDQGGNEARPKVMALLLPQRRIHGGLGNALHSQSRERSNWRRRMGIEPTWDFVEPHHGFEDQERHQVALRLPNTSICLSNSHLHNIAMAGTTILLNTAFEHID